jgi:signal transduction histidine kinase
VNIAPELPLVRADERRLKQIVLNLLSNAVKFTPAGGRIVITAGMLHSGEPIIAVSDTGIGMRGEDVTLALEPFRQIDGALNRRYEGTGLGLPLVQRLVQLHGGTLSIKTAPGAGTTITLRLPADRCIREVA